MVHFPKLPFACGLLLAAAVLAGLLQLNAARAPLAGLTARATGDFALEDAAARTRIWTTLHTGESGQGQLTLGPIRTTSAISFHVSGQPHAAGNGLYFENRATRETITPVFLPPHGFRVPITFTPPPSWNEAVIDLHVVDGSPLAADWIAVAEPVTVPRWAAWFAGAPARVCTFLFVGAILGLCTLAAAPLCRRLGLHHAPLRLLAALALVAITGYATFWCYFASPVLGTIFTAAALLGAAIAACRSTSATAMHRDRDWSIPALLMVAVGTFDVAALHLYAGETAMSSLAQQRFVGNQPLDNALPQFFARRLERGEDPRDYAGNDWRSSDRPPLQTGWLLLLARPAVFLRAGHDAAMQSAGLWLQLLWIPAVWAWLRSIGERPRIVAALIVALAASGFFFFQSVYVWPKLGCAAFVLATFTWWLVVRDDVTARRPRLIAGAATAALAWLAHGGAAFSLVALVPWLVARRGSLAGTRHWLVAAAVCGGLTLPWFAYQKFYDPPGNRLLKWHLAGVTEVDARGTLATLADAYGAKSAGEIVQDRVANGRTILDGAWPALLRFDFSSPEQRRHYEWFHPFFALGWWNLGLVIALVASITRRAALTRGLSPVGGWTALTLVLWAALLFLPGTTFIHHGSYAVLLVLFPLGALALWRVHRLAFAVVAGVQIISFVLVWLPRPAHWPALPAQISSLVLMGLAGLAAALTVWRAEPGRLSVAPLRDDDTTTRHPSPLS